MADVIHPDANPVYSTPVSIISRYIDRISIAATLPATTSKTIAELLGVDVESNDASVTIVSDGTIQYNPVGEAVATSGFLPSPYTIPGGKTKLDLVEFYAAAEKTVSLIVHEIYEG